MSYTYLQEQGAESSAAYFADIPASVLWRLNLTAGKYCSSDSETNYYRHSRSGMMSEPSTEDRGGDSLMSCAVDSHVRTSPVLVAALESQESEADCGPSSLVSLARFDPGSRSLKTRQTLLFEDSTECLLILPRWGWMLDGECFLLAPLVLHTHVRDCGYWPTPCLPGNGGSHGKAKLKARLFPTPRADSRDNCGGQDARKKAQADGTYIGRNINPQLQEWLMDWPIDWTVVEPLATDKFQQWLDSHGISSHKI